MRLLLLFFAVLIGLSERLEADLVVNWHGLYVSSTQPLAGNAFIGNGIDYDNDSVFDDEIGGRAFSVANPLSPSSGYSGTSGTFYGGAIVARLDYSGGDTMFDKADIKNQGPNDSVHFHAQHGSALHNMHAILFWQQPDFLNGGSPITFNSASFARIAIGSTPTEGMVGSDIRLIVRDNSNNYWLSETAFSSPNANDEFLWNSSNQGFSATSDGRWASYDPTKAFTGFGAGTDLRFDSSGPYSDQKFSSITGVGIFGSSGNLVG